LGLLTALAISPVAFAGDLPTAALTLLTGTLLSVLAFPTLTERWTHGNDRTRRRMTLACAAADDVSAWCLLVVVVGVARADLVSTFVLIALTVVYLGFTPFLARPFIVAVPLQSRCDSFTTPVIALVLATVLLGVGLTLSIGPHALFGAFLVGSVLPGDWLLMRRVVVVLQQSVTVLLLPAFFAFPGLPTENGLVNAAQAHLICAAIIVVFTAANFGGTLAVARVCGVPWCRSEARGVLMKTRGLMELIVLNIGLDQRFVSPTLLGMLFITAVAATTAAGPMLRCDNMSREQSIRGDAFLEPSGTARAHLEDGGWNQGCAMLHCSGIDGNPRPSRNVGAMRRT
jgi:Kef-type K+ transport system membrane component KefB